MKSRLDELLRQRELLHTHVRWLDDEIAAERARLGQKETAPPTNVSVPHADRAATPLPPAPLVGVPVEPDVKNLHNEVRRGCFVYFFIAAILLGAVVAFIYWKYGSSSDDPVHPESLAEPEAPPPPLPSPR